MMTEAEYGAAMRAMAQREGHMKALPPSPQPRRVDPRETPILAMLDGGVRLDQIAAAMGLSRGRVSQIVATSRRGATP